MRPTDLALLRTPEAPSLAPDGSWACYAVARLDLDADTARRTLWAVPTDGAAPPRPLTHGPRDASPRISPDGRWVAFLRAGDDAPAQLHLMPADGGEPSQLTTHPLGAGEPVWSPDSRRIAYTARVPEPGRYGTAEDVPADKEPPRRITTRRYRLDDLGWTIDRRPQVFVVDALAAWDTDEPASERTPDADVVGAPRQLTDFDTDHGDPTWSPDGQQIGFVAARHDGRDTDFAADVFVIPADGGAARQLTDTSTSARAPIFAADGTRVAFLGHGEADDVAGRTVKLLTVPAGAEKAAPTLISDADDELNAAVGPPARLALDGDAVLAARATRGSVELRRYPLDASPSTAVLDGPRQVRGFDHAAGTVVAVAADGTSAGEVVAVDDAGERLLTACGAPLAEGARLHEPVELHTTTADDDVPVHGWLVLPDGPGPHPVLLCIHGGPHAQYGWALFDEAQVYAGAGYAVVLGNPRGSQGYGEAHGRAVVGAFGDRDRADLLALLDAALADGRCDGERVGVMGGSYGGFMATWLAAHDGHRFRAAIVERALTAADSFAGSSDIGATFPRLYIGPDEDAWRTRSPLAHAAAITLPTLIIHSEQDWRCPLEQAQRLYGKLRDHGTPAEMLIFPGEGHELSRSGLPSHRVQRFEAILDWWDRHLS